MIRLFNCDNLQFMKSVPDKFYELAIVDPPYGIDWMQQIQNPNTKANWKQYENKEWDKQTPTTEYWEQLFRVSKNQIVWGGNYMTENLKHSPCWLIWDKMQEFSGAVFEMAWTSFTSPAKAFRMSRVEAYANKGKIHPTQKPVALYKWLLKNYAKEGDKIFDSHSGSLSIAIACGEMGFDLDACELDGDYFKDSVARVQRHFTQSNAFMKTPEILVNP